MGQPRKHPEEPEAGAIAEPNAADPWLAPSAGLEEDLQHAIGRERRRLQRSLEAANAELAARDAELDQRAAELEKRDENISKTLQTARELGARIETEARARAAAIEAEAGEAAEAREAEVNHQLGELELELGARRKQLATVEQEAHEQAEAILTNAKQRAEQIVADAGAKTDSARARVIELLRLREGLLASVRDGLRGFDEAIERVERGEVVDPLPADTPQPADSPQTTADSRPSGSSFASAVTVTVSPVRSIAELGAVEGALSELEGVRAVRSRRLANARAEISLDADSAAAVLGAMRRAFALPFSAHPHGDAKLAVRLETESTK